MIIYTGGINRLCGGWLTKEFQFSNLQAGNSKNPTNSTKLTRRNLFRLYVVFDKLAPFSSISILKDR